MTYEEMEQIAGLDMDTPEERERALAWRIEDRPTMEWAMGRLAVAEEEAERVRLETAAALYRVKARGDALLQRLERGTSFLRAAAEEYARTHRKDLLVRGKTAHLIHGDVSYRSQPEKVVVEDEDTALAWCMTQHANLVRLKPEIDKKALSAHVLSTGEIPPGVAIVPPSETITLKPSQPETIHVSPAPKEIK